MAVQRRYPSPFSGRVASEASGLGELWLRSAVPTRARSVLAAARATLPENGEGCRGGAIVREHHNSVFKQPAIAFSQRSAAPVVCLHSFALHKHEGAERRAVPPGFIQWQGINSLHRLE